MRLTALIILSFTALFSLTAGQLTENDKRLHELKGQKKNLPDEEKEVMKLTYRGPHGNFLVFYDFAGETIYLQYRRDKWDYRNDHLLKELVSGETYYITFRRYNIYADRPGKDSKYLKKEKLYRQRSDTSQVRIRPLKGTVAGYILDYSITVIEDIRL